MSGVPSGLGYPWMEKGSESRTLKEFRTELESAGPDEEQEEVAGNHLT
jgi:hypothetical protein